MEDAKSMEKEVFFDSVEHEKQHRARINNNCRFLKAQQQVFSNINQVDKLIAYSVNMNVASLAQVKYRQIQSLLTSFKQEEPPAQSEAQKTFKNIIKNRFQQQIENDEEMVQQDDQDDEFEDDYDDESDREGIAAAEEQPAIVRQRSESSSNDEEDEYQSQNLGSGEESDGLL